MGFVRLCPRLPWWIFLVMVVFMLFFCGWMMLDVCPMSVSCVCRLLQRQKTPKQQKQQNQIQKRKKRARQKQMPLKRSKKLQRPAMSLCHVVELHIAAASGVGDLVKSGQRYRICIPLLRVMGPLIQFHLVSASVYQRFIQFQSIFVRALTGTCGCSQRTRKGTSKRAIKRQRKEPSIRAGITGITQSCLGSGAFFILLVEICSTIIVASKFVNEWVLSVFVPEFLGGFFL